MCRVLNYMLLLCKRLCHAQHVELEEEGGRGGHSEGWLLFFQVRDDGALLSWNDWTPACSWQSWMEALFCFSCVPDSCLLVKLSFYQPTSFLTFTFLILSPAPLGKAKQLLVAESLAGVKPWHTKNLNMSAKTKVSIKDYTIPYFPSWLANTDMEN